MLEVRRRKRCAKPTAARVSGAGHHGAHLPGGGSRASARPACRVGASGGAVADDAKAALEAARARLRWAQACPSADRDSLVAAAKAGLEAAKQALSAGQPGKSAQDRVDGLVPQLARD